MDLLSLDADRLLKDHSEFTALKPAPAFPSSLPAPPRISNPLRPPPRATGLDSDDGDRAVTVGQRLMQVDDIVVGRAMRRGGWLAPSHSQRVARLDTRVAQRGAAGLGRSRRSSSDKWRYMRSWRNPDRHRNYPQRRDEPASSNDSAWFDDKAADDSVAWQAGDQSNDEKTGSRAPATELPSETVAAGSDKECLVVSGSSAVSDVENVP